MRSRRHRGAAAVEFALIVPLLVMILFGIIEFGYAFYVQASVAGAARVGVRNYSINYSQPSSSANAVAVATSAVPVPADVISAVLSPACTTAGAQTTMVITYRYHSLTGLLDGFLGGNITGKGSMACGG